MNGALVSLSLLVIARAAGPIPASGPSSPGLVPWRDPVGDVGRFFPGGIAGRSETRILSHRRLELTQRLGRPPVGDDLLLRLYPVRRAGALLGYVMVRRVKGEHGALELVLAVTPEGRVRGCRLQRSREPHAVGAALQRFLPAFDGKRVSDSWRIGGDLPAVPAVARRSAAAVADGARTALILLQLGDQDTKD